MTTITQDELDELCQNGQAVDDKAGYPAVVLHPDGTITKLWARKKKLFSSATLYPYSNRFVDNARELNRRGIVTPEIINHAAVENSHIKIVTYRSLPGRSIRESLKTNPSSVNIEELCHYISELHDKGILFRGMHLGNIIQRSGAEGYALIDFTDVKFFSKPVPLLRRAANLATPLRYRKDIQRIKEAGHPGLLESYVKILRLDEHEKQRFKSRIDHHLK